MASIIIAGGVAIHEAVKHQKKKRAAKRAALEPNFEELQAENQKRFDHIQAQQDPYRSTPGDAPPEYNIVVTDESRKAALGRVSGDSDRASRQSRTEAQTVPAASSTTALVGDDSKAGATVHPAYRSK